MKSSSVAVKKSEANAGDLVQRGLDSFRKLRLARHSIDHQAHFELAQTQELSASDAAYLPLAVVLNAPLVTYDRVLASAANRVLSSR